MDNFITVEKPVSVTFKLDKLLPETAGKLEAIYLSGRMEKRAKSSVVCNLGFEGYQSCYVAIINRMNLVRPAGYVVDHINSNPGDNRRENLRVITRSENNVKAPRLVIPDNYADFWAESWDDDGTTYYQRTYHLNLVFLFSLEDKDIADKLSGKNNFPGLALRIGEGIGAFGIRGLHRMVMHLNDKIVPKGMTVDHLNNDSGDNRFKNLDVKTPSDNNMNRRNKSDKPSQYVGVNWDKEAKKWMAKAHRRVNGKTHSYHFGRYTEELQAALAYNSGVIRLGLNKPLNIIEGHTSKQGYPLRDLHNDNRRKLVWQRNRKQLSLNVLKNGSTIEMVTI